MMFWLYACCEHCKDDQIHDVPVDGHLIPCNYPGNDCREGRHAE